MKNREKLLSEAIEIHEENGICPALNSVLVALATQDFHGSHVISEREFNRSFDTAIKSIGLKPAEYHAHAREFF